MSLTFHLSQISRLCRQARLFAFDGTWRALIGSCLICSLILGQTPVQAQENSGLIRDAEIEQLLSEYVTPILKAAHQNVGAVRIFIINDRSFNAFVADGRKIFINTGALMDAKTPNEIIGVLAHETGHMADGHLARMREELARAQIFSVIGLLAGVGSVAATTRRSVGPVGADGTGQMGALLGPQELVQRTMLAYVRGQEEAADRAAIKFLTATGQSGAGLLATLERFENESLFRTASIDPYLQTHPLPRERLSNLETVARASPSWGAKDSPALQARHDMMRAKLFGFTGSVSEIIRRYPVSDQSIAARYARAISAYRYGRSTEALAQIDGLLAAQPQNPYFYELKGQVLLESGHASQSLEPLRKAVSMAPNGLPIRVLYGHALVAANQNDEAIKTLIYATQHDQDNGEAYQYLSMAYDKKGDTALAQLAAAQSLFEQGSMVAARTQAARAQKNFPEGSPNWLKADDILNYRPPKLD